MCPVQDPEASGLSRATIMAWGKGTHLPSLMDPDATTNACGSKAMCLVTDDQWDKLQQFHVPSDACAGRQNGHTSYHATASDKWPYQAQSVPDADIISTAVFSSRQFIH